MSIKRVHPLSGGAPPDWASGWGQDRRGVFVEIEFAGVVQRMRWVFPGSFWMASPEGEEGRFDWEGPLHRVRLSDGFWLADTPCTQAHWEAVMGENPSKFVSPDRPVDQVSWEDCERFFERAEDMQPGLALRLPTEAQWEYACRAGTETATWFGDLEIRGERDAPLLDGIAWYGGNSGVDFDLEEGWDSADWKEKQHDHQRAGTRIVKTKAPNPWGFYDMLGNVLEWCVDQTEFPPDSYPAEGERLDPILGQGTVKVSRRGSRISLARGVRAASRGSRRVLRGGSWFSDARDVRAAYRDAGVPGLRFGNVGFRLSRGPGAGGQ